MEVIVMHTSCNDVYSVVTIDNFLSSNLYNTKKRDHFQNSLKNYVMRVCQSLLFLGISIWYLHQLHDTISWSV